MACLNVTPGVSEGLIYEYINEPCGDAAETMHAHRGIAFLRLSGGGEQLEGGYYSGRGRTNYGTIQLRRLSPERLTLQTARDAYKRMETEQHG